MNPRIIEENVVQVIMAIELGCLESSVSGLDVGEWCTRVFSMALQEGTGVKNIKK